MPFALFGIENDGVNLAVNLLVFFLVVLWLALVYWTYADAQRRIDDPMLVGCATAGSLFPFIGTIVYAIVRPPEYLSDARERELEIKAAEGAGPDDRGPKLPQLRRAYRAELPGMPQLHAKAQGSLPGAAESLSSPAGRSARTARPKPARARPPPPAHALSAGAGSRTPVPTERRPAMATAP